VRTPLKLLSRKGDRRQITRDSPSASGRSARRSVASMPRLCAFLDPSARSHAMATKLWGLILSATDLARVETRLNHDQVRARASIAEGSRRSTSSIGRDHIAHTHTERRLLFM